jgi:hypothetical protein
MAAKCTFLFSGIFIPVCSFLISLLSLHNNFLQKARIQVWLYEQTDLRIEGRILVPTLFLVEINSIIFLSLPLSTNTPGRGSMST